MKVSPGLPPTPSGTDSGERRLGFLVLDKPAGLTSHACVNRVRRTYGLRRVGHGGTLDPAVTGVLPIAVGAATRLLPYLPGGKSYRGVIQLGLRTSSDDLEGEVLETRGVPPLEEQELNALLDGFRGEIQQRPPRISAVHIDGERAYVRARRGEQPEPPPRAVTLHRLELIGWDPITSRLEIELDCSAGTYVRSLARDLGERLGCGGALAQLRRTAALGFNLAGACDMESLMAEAPPPLRDPLEALSHLPRHHLDALEWPQWRCGRPLTTGTPPPAGQAVAVLDLQGRLAGIALSDGHDQLQPRLVFDAAG